MAIGGKHKKKHVSKDIKLLEIRREERALHLFTNRDNERKVLAEFFHTIHQDAEELKQPVLGFYGVGGIGKSSLLRRAWGEFQTSYPESDLRLIHLDLDSDKSENISPLELLWKLRLRIHDEVKVPFYLFDLLYLKYKEKNNEPVDLKTSPVLTTLESLGGVGDALSVAAEGLQVIPGVSEIGKLVVKGVSAFWETRQEHRVAEKFGIQRGSFDELDIPTLERLMPKVFAEELGLSLTDTRNQWYRRKANLKNLKPTLCIVLDGYERISGRVEKVLVEAFISPLLTHESYYPHLGFVFLGRNKLDWSGYDQNLQEETDSFEEKWETYIDSHRLGGLSQDYANQFLDAAMSLYEKENDHVCALTIKTYREAITQASKDTAQDGQESFHPFYLDLCLEMVEKQKNNFVPAKHLGNTPKDLIQRFLKYLDDDSREWHWAFALASEFDEELFVHLLDSKSISGNAQNYHRFVLAYSYITPQKNTESYRFHRLMQDSLISDIASKGEAIHISLRKSVVDKLIAFYDAKFIERSFESITPDDAEHYERANEMLMTSVKAKLISVEDAYAKHCMWDKPFAPAFFKLREDVARSWLALNEKLLGGRHPNVAISLNNLAYVLGSQGKNAEAEELFREALAMRRELLGDKHPNVATSLNNLAGVLNSQGKYAEAKELFREALAMRRELLGDKHPNVASSLNNLASVLGSQGKHDEAERMHRESLAMRRELLGDKHPSVATSLNNLALVLKSQGKLTNAEAMHREALAMRRELLGDKHPDVASSLNNLANDLVLQGKGKVKHAAEAEAMHREALVVQREQLGKQHPDVANTLSFLALALLLQGKNTEVEGLLREAETIYLANFDGQHPDVIACKNLLRAVVQKQRTDENEGI